MSELAELSDAAPERFCPQCGKSCVPLPTPHLSTECKECGRTIYFVRLGDGGKGIKVEAGERFTIPNGYIRLSLEPKAGGRLFRAGLPFLLNTLFLAGKPKVEEFSDFVRRLEGEWDQLLTSSGEGHGLNLSNPADTEELARRLEGKWQSRTGYMLTASMIAGELARKEMSEEARESAWAGYMIGTLRGLTIVSEPLFEETLWRGYLANEVVYEAAAAAGNKSPAEIEALKRLQPLFAQFDEATLSALVESGVPIGPKINVAHLPEELLRSLARHQLSTLQRNREDSKEAERVKREEARHLRAEQRQDTEIKIKWAGVGAAIATVIVSGLALAINWSRSDSGDPKQAQSPSPASAETRAAEALPAAKLPASTPVPASGSQHIK